MIKGTFPLELKCDLTPVEVAARARELGTVQKEIEDKEAAKKDFDARAAAEIKRLGLKRQILAREVRDEATFRGVPCREEVTCDDGRYCVCRIRTDTGEVVDTRPATEDERQSELPMETVERPARPWMESDG